MTQADPVAIARTVVDDPRRLFTLSNRDMLAVFKALVVSDGRSQISNELAAVTRLLIDAEARHTLAKGPAGHAPLAVAVEREQAFHTFKRHFTEEFPDV